MDFSTSDLGVAAFSGDESQKSGAVGICRNGSGLRPYGTVLAQCAAVEGAIALAIRLANVGRNAGGLDADTFEGRTDPIFAALE